MSCFFFFNDTATTEIYTLSLHDALPIYAVALDPNDTNTIYVGTDAGVYRTTNLGANWEAFDNGIPNVVITDLHIDITQNLLFTATFGRGMYKLNIAPGGTEPPVDLYLRDSLLDTGERFPSPSNLPNPNDISDQVYWWESPDIKVNVIPYYTPDAVFDGVEFDDDVIHDDPIRDEVNRFYLQVHNRGWQETSNVRVRAFYADASAGLPPLPNALIPPDFNLTSTVDWQPIGPAKTVPLLEPNRPVIVSWDWTVPSTSATHSCLLAVVSSADDPITTTETNVNNLINSEKRACLKNLHVIDSPGPRPPQTMVTVNFNNVKDEDDVLDIIIDPIDFTEGIIGLVTEKLEFLGDEKDALMGTGVYEVREGEDIGKWYIKPGTKEKVEAIPAIEVEERAEQVVTRRIGAELALEDILESNDMLRQFIDSRTGGLSTQELLNLAHYYNEEIGSTARYTAEDITRQTTSSDDDLIDYLRFVSRNPERKKVFLGGDGLEFLNPVYDMMEGSSKNSETYMISRIDLLTKEQNEIMQKALNLLSEKNGQEKAHKYLMKQFKDGWFRNRKIYQYNIRSADELNPTIIKGIFESPYNNILYGTATLAISTAASVSETIEEYLENRKKQFDKIFNEEPKLRERAIEIAKDFVDHVDISHPLDLADYAGTHHVQPQLVHETVRWIAENWDSELSSRQRRALGNDKTVFENANKNINYKLAVFRGSKSPLENKFEDWIFRSEERRVGKECRSRWSPYH